jgi:large subunit ribosomal protein L9
MPTMKILLREDVDNLGGRGEIVRVKAGYARNFLLPRRLAVEATPSNVKQIERERAALLKRAAQEKATAELQAGQLQNLHLVFKRRVGEQGALYGSVTSMDIAEALQQKGYEIDRRRIILPEPIKTTGDFKVRVRLHRDVTAEIPITVADENAAPVEAQTDETATAAAEAPAQ